MKLPLLDQTGGDRADDVSYQKTQNWYPHITSESKSQMVHYPTPGLTLFSTVGVGEIRGDIVYGNEYYCVSGTEFYRVSSTGAKTLLGTLNTSNGRCSLAHNGSNNGQQIAIADGTDLYIYDSGAATFTTITQFNDAATALFNPTHVVFMDSYFIANDPANSGRFYISAGYDGTDWDTLDFATAERSPDELQSIVVSNRNLWLIGTKTAEPWFNSGVNADFPFEPVQSGYSQWGTIAPYSAIEIAGTVLWLSQNDEGVGQVILSSGGAPQVISTMGIAAEISKLTTLTDAYAWAYQYQQHTFYVLSFPTDGKTFVYDLSIQKWHEWSTESTGYHRSNTHAYVYGKHLIGDPVNGRIYQLDWDKYTDNGEAIMRIRRSAGIQMGDVAVRHYAVHLDIKEGVGNSDITDPQMKLRWRDNNGAWSNYYSRSMGKIGDNQKKVVWRRLGRSYERVYEFSTSDPCNATIIEAYGIMKEDSREIG